MRIEFTPDSLMEPFAFQMLLPSGADTEILSYGQGEGQFRLEQTVWGFYWNDPACLRLEQGELSPEEFQGLASLLVQHIQDQFGADLRVRFVGEHFGDGWDRWDLSQSPPRRARTPRIAIRHRLKGACEDKLNAHTLGEALSFLERRYKLSFVRLPGKHFRVYYHGFFRRLFSRFHCGVYDWHIQRGSGMICPKQDLDFPLLDGDMLVNANRNKRC
jgi:hypothetical protein